MPDIERRKFLKLGLAGAAVVAFPACRKSAPGRAAVDAGAGRVVVPPPDAALVAPADAGAAGGSYFARQFGVGEELLRRTIARGLAKGGDFCDVFLQHKRSNDVGYEDGQVNVATVRVDLGAGVRVLLGDQTGYAFTEDLSPEALAAAADTAAAIASGAARAGPGALRAVEIPALYTREAVWQDVPPPDKLAVVDAVGKLLAAGDPAVIKASVRFRAEDDVVLVANADGIVVEDHRPMTYLYATCTAEKDGRKETNWYSRARRKGPDFYTEELRREIAAEAVKRTMMLFDAVTPPAGEMPVVLAPATSGILLHEAMGHGFEADFNRKEISIFSSMMGRQIAEDFVTIVDTALEPDARGAVNVDDEGTPGQRTVLVENGKLVSYLHDRISATHFQVPRTGNGRREDFRFPPIPRMRLTFMENGPHAAEEILKSVAKGIYAIDFSNGQVTIGAGDYSFYVKTGYLIEDGKITSPIKDVNLIGNGPDSLAKVAMVGGDLEIDRGTWTCGKDGQGVPVGMGLPTVKISGITVGGVQS
jgi:TldD protein